jgi:hypothetical protein
MLKIWGRTNSVNVKKAMWCVEELGLRMNAPTRACRYSRYALRRSTTTRA